MTKTRAFKKGQPVTEISDWDQKGTVGYRHAVVYSCGAKQMVLTCATTGAELGNHFRPEVATFGQLGTFPRMTDDEAIAACLAAGAAVLTKTRERIAHCRTNDAYSPAGLDQTEAALHEPRAVRMTDEHERIHLEALARYAARQAR